MRVYLVVIDDSPQAQVALRFAGRRAAKTGGGVTIAAVVAPPEFVAFGGVQATIEAEALDRAEALVAAAAGTLLAETGLTAGCVVREGEAAAVVRELLAEDPTVAALVLGAAPSGTPGALVGHFAGADAGALPVPVTIVPGSLAPEDIDRLS